MTQINLVMIGGGTRLLAYIGALFAIQEMGGRIAKVAGASGGSIVGALLAHGYSLKEMRQIVFEVDYCQFKDFNLLNLFSGKGLYSGKRVERWVSKQLKGACFKDLALDFHVLSTDLLERDLVVFNRESHPDMPVSQAILFSISIPGIFTYKLWNEKVVVDGAMLPTLGADLFAGEGETKTVVLRLANERSRPRQDSKHFTTRSYFLSLIEIMISSQERERIPGNHWPNTVLIQTGEISPLDFNLTTQDRAFLFEQGYQQVKAYLKL